VSYELIGCRVSLTPHRRRMRARPHCSSRCLTLAAMKLFLLTISFVLLNAELGPEGAGAVGTGSPGDGPTASPLTAASPPPAEGSISLVVSTDGTNGVPAHPPGKRRRIVKRRRGAARRATAAVAPADDALAGDDEASSASSATSALTASEMRPFQRTLDDYDRFLTCTPSQTRTRPQLMNPRQGRESEGQISHDQASLLH
jgi:hypothetical protein